MFSRLTMLGARYVAQRFGLLALFGTLLFQSAGSWTWLRGWLYIFVTGAVEVVSLLLLVAQSPETVNQRGAFHGEIKSFDRVFAGLWLVFGLGASVVAGFDVVRFGWSSLPWGAFAVGLVILLLASGLGTWAMLENEHFEQFVGIQTEQRHRVVSTGPDSIIRHPAISRPSAIASLLMLSSLWMFVPMGVLTVLFVVDI
jgi:protein-S-isoprenylcysteine O-methyltransferase Ste14